MESIKRIALLDPLVAQRIAAGEVIERPASVVRELLDNAIDAQATSITVELIEGGIERITVIDNGFGIAAEDLPLCCRSHATSKVFSLEDLYSLSTMGFRGEALYSISATAKVTISSGDSTFVVDNGVEQEVVLSPPVEGTRVDVEALFASIPARRLFLKRPSTEFTMCRNVLIEKALAFPQITFRLYDEKGLRLDLFPTTTKERILSTLSSDKRVIPSDFVEMKSSGDNYSLYLVGSTFNTYRSDRKQIKIYINKRPVEEFALVQAVTYGYSSLLPGGAFPYCYLFVDINPELVDFNIHPAKREVKIRNMASLHKGVVETVRSQLPSSLPTVEPVQREFTVSEQRGSYSHTPTSFVHQQEKSVVQDTLWYERAKEALKKREEHLQKQESSEEVVDFTYIGQLFNLFLVVERNSSLYLIDQHAAHERILYDQIRSEGGMQRLMIPISFEVEHSVDLFLQNYGSSYANYSLELNRLGPLEWELATIPALWKPIEKEVVEFISSFESSDISELEKRLYSSIACHKAIKGGDSLDSHTALSLIQKVFALERPVCPHGRVFVVEITKEQLLHSVGRIVN